MKKRVNLTPYSRLSALPKVLLYVLILASPAFGEPSGGVTVSSTPGSYSLGDVLFLSAIGKNETPFTLLSLWNFGEGWLEPWIPPPNGELHLQRGGWVNTASGFFSRELDPAFTFDAGTSGTRDRYEGAASLFVPLNRRLQIGLFVPFVDSLQSTGTLPSATSFGDVVITPQVMLEETETLSLSALLAIRTPTGEAKTINDKTILTPSLAVWQDLPAGWQWRGGLGMDFATHSGEGFNEIFDLNLAAGNTLTRHGAAPFGDLTPYLSANLNQFLGGSGTKFTFFSLTPGIRFFLGWHTYFITGVDVPVTNPKPFLPGLTAVLSRGW
ncbi:MAG: hypothetical protein JOZ29_10095 [Deltaproteobacteria bacterium]|nr:hypothetical protein [Deltaproteobacteria bacterium]